MLNSTLKFIDVAHLFLRDIVYLPIKVFENESLVLNKSFNFPTKSLWEASLHIL